MLFCLPSKHSFALMHSFRRGGSTNGCTRLMYQRHVDKAVQAFGCNNLPVLATQDLHTCLLLTGIHVLLQAEGCFEAGAVSAEQPPRLFLPSLSPAGADAQAEWQSQPGNPLPGRWRRQGVRVTITLVQKRSRLFCSTVCFCLALPG